MLDLKMEHINNIIHPMKLKNNHVKEYLFFPPDGSKIYRRRAYKFTSKSKLIKFLNNHLNDSVNGTVKVYDDHFGGFYAIKQYFVWYNDWQPRNAKLKIDLRILPFRVKHRIVRSHKISKIDKKWLSFSEKIFTLMTHIGNSEIINESNAKNLVKLFIKRGFIDWTPDDDELKYINCYIENGIDFYHWSDRCNMLRVKTIIEYFKKLNLI